MQMQNLQPVGFGLLEAGAQCCDVIGVGEEDVLGGLGHGVS